MSNLSKYWLWYLFRLLAHFKIKTNFKFQIFKLFTESLRNKGQSKRNKERTDENNCLICFLRGQFLDSKAKTRGIEILIWGIEVGIEVLNWYLGGSLRTLTLLIHTRKLKKKNSYFCRKFKLDKVVYYMYSFIDFV